MACAGITLAGNGLRHHGDPHQFTQPRWTGEALQGKTILVYAEQGLGDTLQFVRFVPLLEQRGAQVLLWVPQALQELLASVSPNCRVATHIQQLPPFDYECPLMSLPGAFRTSLDDVPSQVPYLRADAARRLEWESLLGPRTGLRVGLAWSGSGAHRNHRSVPVADAGRVAGIGLRLFVSVQKELSDADLADLKRQGKVRHFGERLNSMADTAALLECMDLVISVDNEHRPPGRRPGTAALRDAAVSVRTGAGCRAGTTRRGTPAHGCFARPRCIIGRTSSPRWKPRWLASWLAAWLPGPMSPPRSEPKQRQRRMVCTKRKSGWRKANRMEDAGDVRAHWSSIRQAAQAAPKYPEAQLNLGIGLAAAGDAAGAAVAYEELLALEANNPFGNYNYANLAYQAAISARRKACCGARSRAGRISRKPTSSLRMSWTTG
jgi:hypothetical protein